MHTQLFFYALLFYTISYAIFSKLHDDSSPMVTFFFLKKNLKKINKKRQMPLMSPLSCSRAESQSALVEKGEPGVALLEDFRS